MKPDEYPVFAQWYTTLDWILNRCESFPKDVRFTISSRIANLSLDVMEGIIEAIYTKNRRLVLQRINLQLEKLRILFRISMQRRYLSMQQYEYVSREINETGKMIGGWMKTGGQ